ncbi:MAG: hypothetical protein CMP98_15795 [Gammaproteobacteria bacterium]|nr:hypothetical protein [Gammaproteobacteria bacterium]
MKIPKGKLRELRRQMKEKVAEGEIEAVPTRTREFVDGAERPERKTSVRRNLRAQVRAGGHNTQRKRSFAYGDGDLVEVHTVPWQVRRDVKKGDIAMVITSSFNGERVTAQVGAHIVTFMGTQLRPLPEYEDEEQ